MAMIALPAAMAKVTDPSTLQIGTGQGTACVKANCAFLNSTLKGYGSSEVNPIGGTGDQFDIYQTSGGAAALTSPVLAIFAVPNVDGTTAPTLTGATLFPSASTTSSSGGTSVSSPFVGAATLLSGYGLTVSAAGLVGVDTGTDIYSYLGSKSTTKSNLFDAANGSANFSNLISGDKTIGLASATSYSVYVFGINTTLGSNQVLNVNFNSLPAGTYVMAFGYTGKNGNYKVYDTPITEAGMCDSTTACLPPCSGQSCSTTGTGGRKVPEPASIAILITGLAGLGAIRRRRSNH